MCGASLLSESLHKDNSGHAECESVVVTELMLFLVSRSDQSWLSRYHFYLK